MTDRQAFELILELMDEQADARGDDEEIEIRNRVREICQTQLKKQTSTGV